MSAATIEREFKTPLAGINISPRCFAQIAPNDVARAVGQRDVGLGIVDRDQASFLD